MTRDFNKPKRDDARPSFRNTSPNRNRDERSPRPARPRLNRETVDRAWESGAQQQHADYHPRTTGGGQYRPQGQNQGQRPGGWRNTSPNQQSGYSSQNERGGSRPYTSRQENFRDNRSSDNRSGGYRDDRDRRDAPDTRNAPRSFDRPYQQSNNTNGARPAFGPPRRDFGGQRPNDRRDSFNGASRRDGDARPPFQDRGNQRRDFGRPERSDRPTQNTYGDRGSRETPAPNPRWQTRPSEQRNIARGPERDVTRRPAQNGERFEGDYEHFEERAARDERPPRPTGRPFSGNRDTERRPERPFSDNRGPQSRPERPDRRFNDKSDAPQPERHVTRLPDGRVIKGPRPTQRREAQFWTGVSEDTSTLVSQVAERTTIEKAPESVSDEVVAVPTLPQEADSAMHNENSKDMIAGAVSSDEEAPTEATDGTVAEEGPKKRRPRVASAVTRTKKPRSSGPKPSQRGFKWPATPTEE